MLDRRRFLSTSVVAAAMAAGVGLDARGADGQVSLKIDPWLRRLQTKHRQFFDVPHHLDGTFLPFVRNYLNAYRDAYHARPGEVSAAIGLRGTAIAFGLNSEAWAKYRLGAMYGLLDRQLKPLDANVFLDASPAAPIPADAVITALQRRHATVLLCNNVLRGLAETLAARHSKNADAIHQELLGAVISDAYVVPAMVVAIDRAQEVGCSYVAAA